MSAPTTDNRLEVLVEPSCSNGASAARRSRQPGWGTVLFLLASWFLLSGAVTNANVPPVLDSIGSKTVAEGANLTFRIHATDADTTIPTLAAVGVPLNATFVDSGNGAGSLVFNPNYTQSGVYNVTFVASDGSLADSEIVVITVTNTNRPPLLDPIGAKSVAENATLAFRTHATDPDATVPTLTALGVPSNATFVDSLNGAGSFVFNPSFTQSGVYNVTVIASDGSLADSEIVVITVTNTNRPPALDPIGARSVAEGANLSFRTHATDPDGTIPALTALGVPLNATFVDSLNGAGSLVFNPSYTQSGVYNVTFIASDGPLADSEIVAITVTNVNLPPVLDPIGAKSVAENATLTFRTHATDPDGTIPALTADGIPVNVTFVDSLNGSGAFVFNPDYTQSGVYNVTVVASDGSLADSEIVVITVTNTNRAPVLDPIGAKTVAENANLSFRTHATDPDATIPTLTAVGVPVNATFVDSLNGSGSLVFNPSFTQSGVYNVTFITSDGSLADSELVVITVTNTNRAPVLDVIGAKSVAENANLTFRTHASDPDGNTPSLAAVGVPLNATFVDSLNGAGSFVFNPSFAQSGVYNVTVIASDGSLADSEVVVITVTNTNRAPVLDPIGAKTVAENANLSFRTHATDPDATIPTLTAVGVPVNATFVDSLNGSGSLVFNPNFTQSGVFNVTFIASDGSLADSEVVAITVTNTNRAPVLDLIGSKSVAEGANLSFRTHATDPDGTIPALTAVGVPLNATFVDSLNGAGSLIFNPNYTQSGVLSVTIITSDGSLADSEVVAITVTNVNLPPVLDPIGAKSVAENATLAFRTHASDPDGNIPTLTALGVPLNATFVDSLNGAGSFVFNPSFTQSGVFNVTFITSDGSLADSEIVAITVTNTNRAPVLDPIGARSVAEGATLAFRTHASDPDATTPNLTVVNMPLNATFVDSLNGSGSFVFNPDFTESGVYNVTFIASDGSLADSEVVVLTVTNVNLRPVLDSIRAKAVAEGASLSFRAHATDPDGTIPSLTAVGLPLNAVFVDSLNGSGSLVFGPNYTQSGVYNVTFITSDGSLADSELVAITVTNVNLPPVLDPIGAKNVAEGTNLSFRTHASDPDVTIPALAAVGVPLNATFVDSGNGAGSLVFNPNYTQSGVYNITFIASDGALADSEIVAVTVFNVNLAPVLDPIGPKSVPEGLVLSFRAHATDPDGNTPILTAVGVPLNAAFVDSGNGAGSFQFSPSYTQSGVYNVTFITSDGSSADSELVAVTVINVNLPPVLDPIGARSVAEGASLTFRTHATDPDGTIPSFLVVGIPLNAAFVDSGNGAGSFVINPSFTQSGVFNVTFIARDGSLADSELVAITVTNTNRVPILDPIGAKSVAEAATLTFRTHATDPDGPIPILTALGVPVNATFVDSLNGAGSFVFNPNYTQSGVYNVTIIASDGLLADSEVVIITVTNVNLPPVLDPIGAKIVAENSTLAFRTHGSDPDATIPTLTAVGVPLNATFVDSLNGAGSFAFNPSFTQSGVYNVTFITSDGSLADSEIVVITVSNTNRAPVLDPIGAKTVAENATLSFRTHATDPDANIPTLTALGVPLNATFVDSLNGAGSFVFNPDFTQTGVFNVTFVTSDGSLADSEIVVITVTNTNRTPILDPIGAKTVAENATLAFRTHASDPDATIPTLTAIGIPVNATFVDSLNGAGSFVFNPSFTQSGVFNVTFIASDGSLADSEVVVITVTNTNRLPVLDPIGPKTVAENANLTFRTHATDPDGNIPSLTALGVPLNATFVDSLNGAGSFVFNPSFTQSGVFNVTFITSDGSLADSEVVAITVTNVNRLPVLDPIGAKTMAEGSNLSFRTNATDPDGNFPALSAVGVPPNATFVDSLNGAGSLVFNPNYTQSGVYNVTFIATDGSLADSEVVAITVTHVNLPPAMDSIRTRNVTEGTTLAFRVHAVDPDGDALTLFTSILPQNATFVDSGNGAGSFTFNPGYTQSGTYFISFAVQDPPGALDNELVRINVLDAGNQRPVLDPIGPKSVAESTQLQFRVRATDPDATVPALSAVNIPLNAVFVDSANGAGSFVFNPDFTQTGVYNVTFIASDGLLADSEIVVITVMNVNLPPVLDFIGAKSVGEGANLTFRAHATDPDGFIPTLTAVGVPLNATFVDSLNGAGSFVFNPSFTQSGVFNVTFITSDGSLADSEIVVITVTNTNRAPVLDPIGAKTVAENANLTFRTHATDPDATIPTLTAVGVPINATFVDSLNGAGSFVFNPSFTQSGVFNVTIIASDGSLTDSELVVITVTNTNRAPVLDPIGAKSVAENATLSFRTHGTDPDATIPTLTAAGVPLNATFVDSLNGSGSLVFNPSFTQSGVFNVTFIASDGSLADSELVVITVTNTNRTPVLDPIGAKSVAENTTLSFRTHGTDPDGNIPSLTALGVPLNATFVDSLNGAGSFVFSPSFTQSGVFNVTFITSDGSLADSEVVVITVTNTNRQPILDPIGAKTVLEGGNLTFRTHATDSDGNIPTLSALGVPLNATFVDSLNGAGSFVFNPDFTQTGVYNVTFIASDGSLADSEVVVITVSNTNLRPVLDAIGAKSVAEGANLSFRTHASDPDGTIPTLTALGVPLNATFVDSLNGAGSFVFNPSFTQSGVFNVTFVASDGSLADSELVVITVTNTNRPPVLDPIGAKSVAENANLSFRTHGTDSDATTPTLTAIGVPVNATFVDSLNGSGSLVFNPSFTQSGVYNVTFIASDGSLADSELVVITVTNTNRVPVLDLIGAKSVAENANLSFRTHATDPDATIPTLTAVGVPLNATFVDSLNGAGSFVFNPTFAQSGVFNVTFITSDGSLADSELVVITVTNTNLRPVLDPIGAKTVAENATLSFRTHATDPDATIPTLTALGVPLNATFVDSLNGAGSFVFNPSFTQSGVYNVMFIASDGSLADSELVVITVTNTNLRPVLDAIGAKSVAENANLSFRTHATDPDATIPTLTAVGVPVNATFVDSLNGSGSLVFNPSFTQSGVFNVTFIASDGSLADSELVVITVTNTNRAPVLDPIGAKSVAENATLAFRTHATDPDATIPTLVAAGVPVNATFVDSLNGSGSLVFNPNFTQSGVYNVTFIASDGSLADSELVVITVTNTNRPPVLDPIGAKSVAENATLSFRTHATDPDATIPTLTALGVPLNATFVDSLNGAGSFVFNPSFTQSGVFNVTFIASDGSLADSELVVITVTNTNRAPVLDPIGAKTVLEGGNLTFRTHGTDPDATIPTLTAVGVPLNATFVDSLNGAGSFVFNPSFTQTGVYNVTFITSDGSLADSEVVVITVTNTNLRPVLDPIGAKSVAEGASLSFRTHATDPDATIPTLTAVGVPVNATFVDSLNGSGSLVFNPNFTQSGVYNVTFIASDGSLADSDIVVITVTNTNRAPVLDPIGAKTVAENANLTFRTHGTDPDGAVPTLTALGVPVNATFVDSLNGSGSFVFNPNYTQSGVYNVTVVASDGVLADSEIVAITVTNINLPPVLDSIRAKTVAEGAILSFRTHATDPDGTILTLSAVGAPLNATFVDSLNGAGSFVFNADYTQSGVYNVRFITSDGFLADSELVAITVTDVNLPPVLDSIRTRTVSEGSVLSFRIHSTDADGNAITLFTSILPQNATFIDSGNGSGSFVFTPSFTQAGSYFITFAAQDQFGAADNELVRVNVLDAGNQPPILDSIRAKTVAENANLAFRTHATDPDGTNPALTAVGVPLNATFVDSLNGAGSFVFNPSFTQSGVYNITFIASDGGLADSEIVAVTVTNVNRLPVLDPIGAKTVAENANLAFRTHATDPDANIPTLTALGVPLNATFVDSLNGAGSFVFNPSYTQSGVFNVTFITSDGSLADSELVVITVTNTNRSPILDPIGPKTVLEGGSLTFRTHATDPDGNIPSLSAVGVPLNATFVDSLNGAGAFVFNPTFAQSGVFNVTFITSDGSLADSEVVAITVSNTNLRPVLDPIGAKTVAENANLTFRTHATDPDATIPTLTAIGVPVNATFVDSLNGAGSFVFNPSFTQSGVFNVTFIASDGSLADSELVVITVTNTNRPPVLDPIGAKSVAENANLTFRAHATDPDGNILTLTALGVPLNATFVDSLNGAGSLVFNPSFTQSGVYNVTFITSDGTLADSELVVITVTNTNRAPVLDPIGAKTVAENANLTFRTHATDPDATIPTLTAIGVPVNATFVDSLNGSGSLVFNPSFTQSGVYNVTFITSDGSLADSELVVITVTNTNRPPVLDVIGSKNVAEGTTLSFRTHATDLDATVPSLSAVGVPLNAAFVDSGNGAGSFTFSPSFAQTGVYNVTFISSDGSLADSEVVVITVSNTNLAPVLDAIGAKSVAESANLSFRTHASDPDGTIPALAAVGVPLNATFVDSLNGEGSFVFNPSFTQSGVFNVTFITSDGSLADSEVVAITVSNTNLRPVLDPIGAKTVAENANLTFRTHATDPDATIPTLTAVGIPVNATFVDSLNGAGSLVFNPSFTQSGVFNVTFITSDGSLADSEVVAITVTNTNRPPVLDVIGAKTVLEGGNLTFRTHATDPDGNLPTLTAVGVPLNATFVDSLNGAGSFVFNPSFAQSGVFNVTFITSDGSLADSELVVITVTNTNLVPVLDPIGAKTVAENATLAFRTHATDPDATIPVLTAIGVPVNATFVDSLNGAGSFVFNPSFTQSGVFNVTFIASDGSLADSEVVAITVTNTNRTPVLDPIGSKAVAEGSNLSFRTHAADPDGNTPALTAVGVPPNAIFADSGNGAGSFVFNPNYVQSGVYNVTFIASDGSLADSEIVAVTVTNYNPPPVLAPIGPKTVTETGSLQFRISASDLDGAISVLSAVNIPLNAAFVDSANGAGSFTFNPTFAQAGVYDVTFIATDGLLADSEVVTITVTNTNRPPTANAGPDQGPIAIGSIVQLNGSGSSDPDLDLLNYHWRQLAGTSVLLSDSNAASPTFVPPIAGTYLWRLTVDDALATSAPDTVSITVVSKPRHVTDLMASVLGASIQLTWSAITTDTSGSLTTLSRYVVYRGTRAYFTPTAVESIGTAVAAAISFTDNNLAGADVVGDTGTNYFYCLVTVDVAGSRSRVSNRVGEYDFQIYTTSTTDYSFITMPFANTGILTASDLIQTIGTANVNAVSRFIAASQSFESRFAAGFGTNFAVLPGGIYQVNAKAPAIFSIAGRVPDSGTVAYQIVTTSTTDYSYISVPFERELSYSVAQDVLNALPGVLNTLNRFIPTSQSYESRFAAGFGTNFPVRPGRVYQANAAAPGTFPAP